MLHICVRITLDYVGMVGCMYSVG